MRRPERDADNAPDAESAGEHLRIPWVIPALTAGLAGLLTLGLFSVLGMILSVAAFVSSRRHPKRKLARTLSIVAFAISVGTLGIVVPFMLRARAKAYHAMCHCNLEQITLSCAMYREDNDGRYPLAHNWCDATMPYNKTEDVYDCWSGRYPRCDYVYNAALSGADHDDIISPHETVVLFDGVAGWNASGGVESIEYRHLCYKRQKCANVGFADGAVRSLAPDEHLEYWDPFRDPVPEGPAAP